jgi:hypothetical protein
MLQQKWVFQLKMSTQKQPFRRFNNKTNYKRTELYQIERLDITSTHDCTFWKVHRKGLFHSKHLASIYIPAIYWYSSGLPSSPDPVVTLDCRWDGERHHGWLLSCATTWSRVEWRWCVLWCDAEVGCGHPNQINLKLGTTKSFLQSSR